MDIRKYIFNNIIKLKVIPNSSRTKMIEENNSLKMYLKAVPEKNKANLELIKFFKKEFNLRIEIIRGMKGREKVLRVI